MIFIGAELSDPHAHFVTNIVQCIGSGDDLIIDLLNVDESESIFKLIANHLQSHDEQYVVYNAYTVEDFFFRLKGRFPQLQLITVFSDDEWRHVNYDRYLAFYSDIFTIAVKDHLKAYQNYGLKPFYMQWACNPEMFYPWPDQNKDIDVSFIGAAYGKRVAYIKFLIQHGVQLQVFGKGWDSYADIKPFWGGYLAHKGMLEIIARSKINLNFLWTSAEQERCTIKGRTLELAASCAFQLSNDTDEFENYGFIDAENIAVFHDQQEMLDRIQHYLKCDSDREAIAGNAYDHVLQNHTWGQRFQQIFARLKHAQYKPFRLARKYRLMVLVRDGMMHRISMDDYRMDIFFAHPNSDWKQTATDMDGVIRLGQDSTIGNEALYMMVFGLVADNSDIIAVNFYAGCRAKAYWIRFIDKIVEQRRGLLKILPATCLMFSAASAIEHDCKLASNPSRYTVSYIEYPSFWIRLPYYQSRKLRLYFAYHGDSMKQFKAYKQNLKYGKALSLAVDKMWRKVQGI